MRRHFSLKRKLKDCPVVKVLVFALVMLLPASNIPANNLEEYQVKAAFIFNFIAFTEWPESQDKTIDLCVYGKDKFGPEIDDLQTKAVNGNAIKIVRLESLAKIENCQVLFISESETSNLASILNKIEGKPILTVADALGAANEGVMINMQLVQSKIKFEINLKSARDAQLNINSRLLQLATEVYQ